MVLDMQHWKPSPVFPDRYLISDKGEVYSFDSGRILKPETTFKGYYRYHLTNNGKSKKMKAHRLVALAFIPNVENKPQIDHINGIKTDNRVSNLRWCDNRENMNNPITVEARRNKKRTSDESIIVV